MLHRDLLRCASTYCGCCICEIVAKKAIHYWGYICSKHLLDPIKAGFKEYATNLNAVQTILANTQAAGTKLKDVNAALDELNEYLR